ncbi:hypothetical protein LTR37_018297 [Vermiconidia calcicola]|uniref:Uncharacterized protein n=1 Tax=Vermiconidia calcicola TaxID=1690605 RepID=A0ACC3MHG8_9PEZI|nr:hypothetical protein LTR37_018297 [Vermiconidia calcicola]
MPPKKAKAVHAAAPVSASQPDPQRPGRPGRKRRHSDGSNVSDAPSNSQNTTTTSKTTKRRKKTRATPDPEREVIVEEDEDVMEDAEPGAPMCEGVVGVQTEDSIEVSQTAGKHVHFGEDSDGDVEKSTATNLTPHPRKMSVKKRRTMSPAKNDSQVKRFKSSRTSLPPVLSQDEPATKIIHEFEFRPLFAVLGERMRQLVSRRNSSEADAVDDEADADEDMLVLDTQEEISYPQLPSPRSTPLAYARRTKTEITSEESSETTALGPKERKSYQDAIIAFQKEAEDAKASLKILTIELQALGFAGDDESNIAILQSIRESFDRVREFLDAELPGSLPDDATSQDLTEILIANVKEFADRLRTADKELVEKGTLNANLGHQVNGLLDHLAKTEVRNQQLEDEIEETQAERDERAMQRDAAEKRAEDLDTEKVEFETSLERLTESLENYRTEEARLTQLITRMEDEHRNTIAKMNKERQETIQELENQLDQESQQRGEAKHLSEERRVAIVELEERINTAETDRDALRKELEDVKAELEDEIDAKETAEATAENLEIRVERLENKLQELHDELDTLRDQNESERETAQNELADRDQSIEELNHKLREQGKEANELRLRAHEVQTKNQQRIKELEEQMSERDARFQTDMSDEVERREIAEGLAQERAAAIEEIDAQLKEVELNMHNLLVEKDTRIAELEDEVSQKDAEIQNLNDDLQSAEKEYNAEIDALKAERDELAHDKEGLERRVESEAEQMLEIQNDLTDEINDLKAKIHDKQDKILKVEEKARQADQRWEEVLAARDTEIESYKSTTTKQERELDDLAQRNERMDKKFRAYVRRSTDTVEHLQEQLRVAKAVADEEAAALKEEGEDVLAELAEINVPKGEVVASSSQQQHKSIKKLRGRKRGLKDSAIGLEEEDVEEGMMVEA